MSCENGKTVGSTLLMRLEVALYEFEPVSLFVSLLSKISVLSTRHDNSFIVIKF